ncbi:Epoxyqueuosine reductase [Posidoniimonas polymericola]|uniref:Epoxyqueuosine reductase n=1 Tax=Posidoniimonas polymericola TaxID=2528002 RepID=A0A5C5YLT4_9BACT|nr:tRNA epoxyqueuosine(34) reductase QueG [Posidoniimonas polymericola]TWT75921.1 Epoxyqueuosine reductase [Posidoniimonas polymericola]
MTNPPASDDYSAGRRHSLTARLKRQAEQLGFAYAGVCPAVRPPGADHLDDWLEAGYAGQMSYLADRRHAYEHPSHVLDGCRSVMMLAMSYRTVAPANPGPGQARVSRYAWGDADYHDLIRNRLHRLADALRQEVPEAQTRCVVDTAPLLERDFARLAGLGWIGKNTLLLTKPDGSWFFLAALLTDVELDYDAPMEASHCGTCTACLDACPTDAFPQPGVLDASRCISYLTIELRDQVPVELRPGMGDWLFGCDVCQDVCPWNRRSPESPLASFSPQPGANPIELAPLFALDEAGFRQRFRKTPLWRAHRRGLLRSAAIVLGNTQPAGGVELLRTGLHDNEPIVRGASAWALGQYASDSARAALSERASVETDAGVQTEIDAALAAC